MSLLYPWCYLLEFPQVTINRLGCSSEYFAIKRCISIRVGLELLEYKVGVAVQQEVCLWVVPFGLVDLRLGRGELQRLYEQTQRTSFCMVLAVRSQFASGICALYV